MKSQAQIIEQKIRSPYVQGVICRKGWTEQHAAYLIVEFLVCGSNISLHDFLESHA